MLWIWRLVGALLFSNHLIFSQDLSDSDLRSLILLLQNGGNLQSSLSRQQQPLGSAFAQASTPSTAPSQSTSLQSFLSNRGSNFQSSAPSLQFEQPRSTGTQNQFNSFQNNFIRFPSQSTNSFNTQSQDPNLQFAQ